MREGRINARIFILLFDFPSEIMKFICYLISCIIFGSILQSLVKTYNLKFKELLKTQNTRLSSDIISSKVDFLWCTITHKSGKKKKTVEGNKTGKTKSNHFFWEEENGFSVRNVVK